MRHYYANRRGKSKSLNAEAAIGFLITRRAAARQEATLARIDRLVRQSERLEHDVGITVETLALFVRFWLTAREESAAVRAKGAYATMCSSRLWGGDSPRGRRYCAKCHWINSGKRARRECEVRDPHTRILTLAAPSAHSPVFLRLRATTFRFLLHTASIGPSNHSLSFGAGIAVGAGGWSRHFHTPEGSALARRAHAAHCTRLAIAGSAALNNPASSRRCSIPTAVYGFYRLAEGLSLTTTSGSRLPDPANSIGRLVAHHVGAEVHSAAPLSSAFPPSCRKLVNDLKDCFRLSSRAPTFAIRQPAVAVFTLYSITLPP